MHDFSHQPLFKTFWTCLWRFEGEDGESGAVEACGVVGGVRLPNDRWALYFLLFLSLIERSQPMIPLSRDHPWGPGPPPKHPPSLHTPSLVAVSSWVHPLFSWILWNNCGVRFQQGEIQAAGKKKKKNQKKNVNICIDYILIIYKYIYVKKSWRGFPDAKTSTRKKVTSK